MKKILTVFVVLLFSIYIHAKNLQFHKDGTFKIVQFTDLHWNNTSKKCVETIKTMESVLIQEKPDFIVLTGDIVTSEPLKEGWLRIAKVIAEAKTPWAVTFGNHDEEMNVQKETIFALLKTLPFFVGEAGNVSGVGNFALPVYSSSDDNKIENVMYFFDSHDYTHNPKLGSYDWMKLDQIEWYSGKSKEFAKENGGLPIPSLAFFHIPLKEYNEVVKSKNYEGDKKEGVSSSEINSGLFGVMLARKDMMGVFVGHDHDNNYIGVTRGIALGFGQVTGADAYGDSERGGRVIELQEGKFAFHTWITTPTAKKYDFYYPSGLAAITKDTKVQKARNVNPIKQGIRYKYYEYEGKIKSTDKIEKLAVKSEGILPNVAIDLAKKEDYFAFTYEAWLKIDKTAFYKFYTYSDDGSSLYIDGQLVVNNDGGHSAKRENGVIALEKGFHKFELKYFESYMGNVLDVGISSIGMKEQSIPASILFVE